MICPNCKGKGRIEKYNQTRHGICFRCKGVGHVSDTVECTGEPSYANNIRDFLKNLCAKKKE